MGALSAQFIQSLLANQQGMQGGPQQMGMQGMQRLPFGQGGGGGMFQGPQGPMGGFQPPGPQMGGFQPPGSGGFMPPPPQGMQGGPQQMGMQQSPGGGPQFAFRGGAPQQSSAMAPPWAMNQGQQQGGPQLSSGPFPSPFPQGGPQMSSGPFPSPFPQGGPQQPMGAPQLPAQQAPPQQQGMESLPPRYQQMLSAGRDPAQVLQRAQSFAGANPDSRLSGILAQQGMQGGGPQMSTGPLPSPQGQGPPQLGRNTPYPSPFGGGGQHLANKPLAISPNKPTPGGAQVKPPQTSATQTRPTLQLRGAMGGERPRHDADTPQTGGVNTASSPLARQVGRGNNSGDRGGPKSGPKSGPRQPPASAPMGRKRTKRYRQPPYRRPVATR